MTLECIIPGLHLIHTINLILLRQVINSFIKIQQSFLDIPSYKLLESLINTAHNRFDSQKFHVRYNTYRLHQGVVKLPIFLVNRPGYYIHEIRRHCPKCKVRRLLALITRELITPTSIYNKGPKLIPRSKYTYMLIPQEIRIETQVAPIKLICISYKSYQKERGVDEVTAVYINP